MDAIGLNNTASELLAAGKAQEAMFAARLAIGGLPGHWQPIHTLGSALDTLGRPDQAIPCFRQVLQLSPSHADAKTRLASAHSNYAAVLLKRGIATEAAAHAHEALILQPESPAAWCNLGLAHRQLSEPAQAAACYRRGLEIAPADPKLHWNLAIVLLSMGHCDSGWREYEWRFKAGITPPSLRPEPPWQGEPLAGKSIVLEGEQGLGDTIQFVRYKPLLEQRGATVRLVCQSRLEPLLGPYDTTISDCRAHLMSLPLLAGEASAAAYLQTTPAGSQPKTGLCLRGNPDNPHDWQRSIPESLAPLLEPCLRLEMPSDPFHTIADTAAIVAGLDLIITADTMIAHLAGALGKPVWLLLSKPCDWRWGLTGESTHWYPAMRLFRQEHSGDWRSVVERVQSRM